jgi:acyl-CoA synthetase (AMP-forming)/AMP-acid ligase II
MVVVSDNNHQEYSSDEEPPYFPTNTKLYQAETPLIINFSTLLKEAVDATLVKLPYASNLWHPISWSGTLQATIAECCEALRAGGHQLLSTPQKKFPNRLSHVAYTSGSTGLPKGSQSSSQSLGHYILEKNRLHNITHNITQQSTVLLASAVSFDPCLSDVLATFQTRARLGLVPRSELSLNLPVVLLVLLMSFVRLLCGVLP